MDLGPGVRVLVDTSNGVHRGVVVRHWTRDEWLATMGGGPSMVTEEGFWQVRLDGAVGRSDGWIAMVEALTVIDLPDRSDPAAVEVWLG